MKRNRLALGSLIIALSTAGLVAQELQKIMPPPPPKPLDAQTLAARRAIVLSRVAKAPAETTGLAQGGPALNKGVESGGQASGNRTALEASKVPTVNRPADSGAAGIVGTTPAIK